MFCQGCGLALSPTARFCAGCGQATGASGHVGGQEPQEAYPGQAYPGQAYPGQAYPGQAYPGQAAPGSHTPEQHTRRDFGPEAPADFYAGVPHAQPPRQDAFLSPRAPHVENPGGPRIPVFYCSRCGQTLPPNRFFSRGVNVAKMMVLLPINFILPLIYFFVRRDRLICSRCSKLLPDTAPVGFLPAAAGSPGTALTVAYGQGTMAGNLGLSSPQGQALERAAAGARRWGIFWGVLASPFAMGMLAAGSLYEALSIGVPTAALGGVSALFFRRARRHKDRARAHDQEAISLRILDLARGLRGRLNVTQAASHLRVPLKDAEQLLDSMVDGHRVDVEVTDDGRLTYVFPELQ